MSSWCSLSSTRAGSRRSGNGGGVSSAAPRASRHARERLELDGREGEAGFPARCFGVLEEPPAEILVRENLLQRPLHRLLRHWRPPRSRFAAATSQWHARARALTIQESPDFQALRRQRRPAPCWIVPSSRARFHATLLGTRQRARRKRPRHSVGRGPPGIRGIDTVRAARGLGAAGRDDRNLARAKKSIEPSGNCARPSYTRPLISSFGGCPDVEA
jgi:hypothetical protein